MQVRFPASKKNYSGHFVLRLSIPHRTGRLGVKAVALISGPALVIERKKKSYLVSTVSEAKQGAEVLQGLLVR